MKTLAQGFNTAAQDSNPGSRSRESKALPLSHCALHFRLPVYSKTILFYLAAKLSFSVREWDQHTCSIFICPYLSSYIPVFHNVLVIVAVNQNLPSPRSLRYHRLSFFFCFSISCRDSNFTSFGKVTGT